ncbi:MAG: hypothetical protein AAFY81_09695 [Pseudomonadota bacterium]
MIKTIRKFVIRRRLKSLMRPDPRHRDRRLAQMTPERAERYRRNINEIGLL